MYTEEELERLEQDELNLTEEAILAMLLTMRTTKSDLVKELSEFYRKYGTDGVVTYAEARKYISEKNHSRRLTTLVLAITYLFSNMRSNMKPQFKSMMEEVIGMEMGFFDVDIEVEKLLITKWGADTLTWEDRLLENTNRWRFYVISDIKQSIMRGDNIDTILKQIDKRFGSMEKALKSLGITESTAMTSISRKQILKELGFGKYKFYTQADERTCEICGGLHGKVFPMTAYEVGVTASPMHPRCRCFEVPIAD